LFAPTPLNLPREQRRLLRLYGALDDGRKASLLAFAEFLAQQQENAAGEPAEPVEIQTPRDLPRPEDESVVAAMRRLTETYPMIERDALLDRATSLMMAHMLQGQPASEVIDELESLFDEHYQRYLQKFSA